MAKHPFKKTTTPKLQPQKANAPMNNAAPKNRTTTKAKADEKKSGNAITKTIKPNVKKPSAKKTEKNVKKAVLSATAQKRIEDIKAKANGLIICIKQDVQAAVKGEANPAQVQRMFKAMMNLVVEARQDMYRSSK